MLRRAKLLHAAAQQRQSAGKQDGAAQQKQSAGKHGAAQQIQSEGKHGAAQQIQSGSSRDDIVGGVKRKRQLDLKGSPLMRLAASQVGRGAAATTFGDMARAACSEVGAKNVSSGGSAMR